MEINSSKGLIKERGVCTDIVLDEVSEILSRSSTQHCEGSQVT